MVFIFLIKHCIYFINIFVGNNRFTTLMLCPDIFIVLSSKRFFLVGFYFFVARMFLSVPKTEAVTVPTECGPPEALVVNPSQAWTFQISFQTGV